MKELCFLAKQYDESKNYSPLNIRELCFLVENKEKENDSTPTTFREAWDHPDPVEREKWRAAIRKELKDAISRGIYRILKEEMYLKIKDVWNANGSLRKRVMKYIEQD